eukprot:366266-Chlamydomonas_euryale.AAC.2
MGVCLRAFLDLRYEGLSNRRIWSSRVSAVRSSAVLRARVSARNSPLAMAQPEAPEDKEILTFLKMERQQFGSDGSSGTSQGS